MHSLNNCSVRCVNEWKCGTVNLEQAIRIMKMVRDFPQETRKQEEITFKTRIEGAIKEESTDMIKREAKVEESLRQELEMREET